MANREDEFYRQNYYGGHPPACTCVKCTEQRLAGLENTHSAEKNWLIVLIGVSIVAVGWMVYLMVRGSVGTGIGLVLIAVNLGIIIRAISATNHPWSSFRSGILSLVITILVAVISIATW